MYKFLILAASALASAYTTPTSQCTDSCNPIAKPGLNEVVPAGSSYTVTWQPTTDGTVTILLLKGPSTNILPLYPIAEKIANTGTYTWTPATDLQPTGDSGYGLQLINDADGTYQWSTQFGISNADGGSMSASASASTSASGSASESSTAASDSGIATATSSMSFPTGFSNSTMSAASPTGTSDSSSGSETGASTLTTATHTKGSTTASASSSGSASAQASSGAIALGAATFGGAFAAIMAAVAAL